MQGDFYCNNSEMLASSNIVDQIIDGTERMPKRESTGRAFFVYDLRVSSAIKGTNLCLQPFLQSRFYIHTSRQIDGSIESWVGQLKQQFRTVIFNLFAASCSSDVHC